MSTRRMISSDTFEDDILSQLSVFGRLTWIGIITACADDQGRMIDNPAIIRAKVYPLDQDISDDDIENILVFLSQEGLIMRYESGRKRLMQIINWWKYQTPAWASASKYPAPEDWIDREKYHTQGNKIENNNWNEPGGFSALHSQLHSDQDSTRENVNVNGEGDVKGERKDYYNESERPILSTNIYKLYTQNIGFLQPILANELMEYEREFPPEWIEEAFALAAQNNARSWAYVKKILENRKNGVSKPNGGNGRYPPAYGTPVDQIPVFHAGDQYNE